MKKIISWLDGNWGKLLIMLSGLGIDINEIINLTKNATFGEIIKIIVGFFMIGGAAMIAFFQYAFEEEKKVKKEVKK